MEAILRPWCGWGKCEPPRPNVTTPALPRIPSVALVDNLGVAVGYEGREGAEVLSCRNASTGEIRWTQPLRARPHFASPAIDGTAAYLGLAGDLIDGLTNDHVYAVDLRTGAIRWNQHLKAVLPPVTGWRVRNGDAGAPICSVAGDVVWVASQHRLMALDVETGHTEWETSDTEAGCHEPVIHNGWVYVLTTSGSVEAWGPARDVSSASSPDQGE
jgi:outer membrane protein assembly factor BamB